LSTENIRLEDMSNVKAPWLAFYGEVPRNLTYPDCSMYALVERSAGLYPGNIGLPLWARPRATTA